MRHSRSRPVRRRAITLALATVPLLAALAGCTPAPAATVFVTATPAPAETVVVTATPTPAPTVDAGQAAPAPLVPNAPAPEVVEGPAVDLGPRDGAQGPVATDGDGAPREYTVVSGDSFFDVAQRFDVPQQQLLRMNPSIPDLGETLYIGQLINLDWTTTR